MLGRKTPFCTQGTTKVPRALQNCGHQGAGDLQSRGRAGLPSTMCSRPAEALLRSASRPPLATTLHQTRPIHGPNRDEWICEKIVGFRPQDPRKKDGVPQWKAHWEGFSKAHDSWEPASSFLPNFHPGWVELCRAKNISLDLNTCFPLEENTN